MSSARYLVWDFDGTLAHRPGMWRSTLAQAAAAQGHEVDPAVFHPHLQHGFPWHSPEVPRAPMSADEWWAALHPVLEAAFASCDGIAPDAKAEAARAVRRIYCDPAHWEVFADTVPALGELSAMGWRHVILSNHVPELGDLVRDLGLAPHFDVVVTSGVTGVEKPHRAAFTALRDRLGPDATLVMIGDSWRADIRGATAVGWPAVLVRNDHPEARYRCAGLEELPAVLDGITGTPT